MRIFCVWCNRREMSRVIYALGTRAYSTNMSDVQNGFFGDVRGMMGVFLLEYLMIRIESYRTYVIL